MNKADIIAAVEELQRRDTVERVLRLNEIRNQPQLANDPDYRRRFNHYYRVRQRSRGFYAVLYALLYELAAGERDHDLAGLMTAMVDANYGPNLSFCSKILATVSDSAVAFDSNVAGFFDVPIGPLPDVPEHAISEALNRYACVQSGIQVFVQSPEWVDFRQTFDRAFPQAAGQLSDIRKADLLICAYGAL